MAVDSEQRHNLARFGELVLAEPALHEQLRGARDLETFAALAVRLGAERGCGFSEDTVRAVVNERRRAWLERWIQ